MMFISCLLCIISSVLIWCLVIRWMVFSMVVLGVIVCMVLFLILSRCLI